MWKSRVEKLERRLHGMRGRAREKRQRGRNPGEVDFRISPIRRESVVRRGGEHTGAGDGNSSHGPGTGAW